MQMTDSDFTVNDWWRRLDGGGAGHYAERVTDAEGIRYDTIRDVILTRARKPT